MPWEVTIRKLRKNGSFIYKVTRRLPELTVAETRIFQSENEALRQFYEWSE